MGRLCYPTQHPGRVPIPRASGATKLSRCKPACLRSQAGRVWRTFCRHGTSFIEHYACRGTSLIGARKLSRYRIFVGGTGPEYSGVQIVSKPEICHGTEFGLMADARFAQCSAAKLGVRVQQPLQICLECRSKSKKHDKQLTHIVRVRLSFYFMEMLSI